MARRRRKPAAGAGVQGRSPCLEAVGTVNTVKPRHRKHGRDKSGCLNIWTLHGCLLEYDEAWRAGLAGLRAGHAPRQVTAAAARTEEVAVAERAAEAHAETAARRRLMTSAGSLFPEVRIFDLILWVLASGVPV